MLAKLDNPQILSDVVSIISELVTEVKIKANTDGMSITAIDPANVALVNFKLPSTGFSQYESKGEVLGINLDNLKSVLRRAKAGSSLILQTQDNLLNIEIHDKVKRNFSLALIDVDTEDKKMPDLDFKNKIEIHSFNFNESIEDCAIVADSCLFSIKEGKFIIEAKGLHSAKSEFSSDEATITGVNSKSKYSLEYLQKFIKAGKLTEKMAIQFADDYPLRLDFKNPRAELSFVLAPRVETED